MITDVATPRRRIVVGVDGSKESTQALRWAAQIAETTGARLDAIAVWQFPVGFGWSAIPPDWDPEADTHKALTRAVDAVFGEHHPTGLRLSVMLGNPTQVLLDA